MEVDSLKSAIVSGHTVEARAHTRGVLQDLVASDKVLKWFRHPLGYIYFLLLDSGDEQVRLHYWDSDEHRNEVGAIHDHVFSLRSLILAGKLMDTRLKCTENDAGEFRILTVQYQQGTSALLESGKRMAVLGEEITTYRQGDSYEMPPGEFHSSKPLAIPTVTLVYTKRDIKSESPRVLVFGQDPVQAACSRTEGDRVMFAEYCSKILAVI